MINVVVRNGVVDIWGTITDERKRRALIVAAENVPGVKRVNDHVAWIEPMSGMVYEPPGDARGADIRGLTETGNGVHFDAMGTEVANFRDHMPRRLSHFADLP